MRIPDPAFYFDADLDPDPALQNDADPDPQQVKWNNFIFIEQGFALKKIEFN